MQAHDLTLLEDGSGRKQQTRAKEKGQTKGLPLKPWFKST
ncbi:hypothetical protein Z950_1980 [Sulfitobacter mediterraneus KCTC 32188]|nr:hypothetical protein Z950_1980 [Sulfitobacter mediterraneus KCTC 32188]